MNIVRQDFSGGLYGKELHWRSDLEGYAKGLVQASNMLPTPYGGVTRRPPLVSIGSLESITIDSNVFVPQDARIEPFVYSATERYAAIFASYSDSTETTIYNGKLEAAYSTTIDFPGTTAMDPGADDFDIEFDIYCESWPTGYSIPIALSTLDPDWDDTWRLAIYNGNFLLQTYDAAEAEAQSPCNLPSSSEWHSVKIAKSGTSVTWTIDDVVEATGTAKATLRTVAAATLQMTHANSTYQIRNFKITCAATAANEIDVPFDDGSGTTLDDNSANAYDGTVTTTATDFWQSELEPDEDDISRLIVKNHDGAQKAELVIPYTQQEILELDTHHSNDIMWITHQNHPPATLKRIADDEWFYSPAKIEGGPFLTENEDELKTVSVGVTKWAGSIEYLEGDDVFYGDVISDDVDWIGTIGSEYMNTDFASDITPSGAVTWKPDKKTGGYGKTLYWSIYPNLLIRTDAAAVPSGVAVGQQIRLNAVELDSPDWDATFSTTGEIIAIVQGGTTPNAHCYITVNTGAYITFNYETYVHGSKLWLHDQANIPIPTVPAAYEGWFSTAGNFVKATYTTVPWSKAQDRAKAAYFMVPTWPWPSDIGGGGADCSGADNILYNSEAKSLVALRDNEGIEPEVAVAITNSGGDALFTTPASNHFADGDTVDITGSTYHDCTAKIVTGATEFSFKLVGVGYTTADDSGIAHTAEYWDENGTPHTSSKVVSIKSLGHKLFNNDPVGQLIQIDVNELYAASDTFNLLGDTSAEIHVLGQITLSIDSNEASGTIVLETKLADADEWEIVGTLSGSAGYTERSITVTASRYGMLARVRMTVAAANFNWLLQIPDGYKSIYQILESVNESSVIARVLNGPDNYASSAKGWALGAFGGTQGYPGTVTIYENRLWLSGSIGESFLHWGSVVNKFWNFAIGTFATSAIIFQARADSSTRISWVEPKDNLFFGTDFGEYSAVNLDQTNVLSATNPPKIERHTSEGSARIPAQVVGNALAFVSANKKKLKLMRYDGLEQDGFRSYDMTFMNPDIAGSGFVGHCLQRSPFPVLWLWTADGNAVSFTIDREHNVIGWAEHSTADGLIKSMCVLPDENGIDEIYAVVERTQIVKIEKSTGGEYYLKYDSIQGKFNEYFPNWDENSIDYVIPEQGADAPARQYEIVQNGTEWDLYDHEFDAVIGTASDLNGTFFQVAPGLFDFTSVYQGGFVIEKLDYSQSEHTDNLTGLSEKIVTSIFEPTPLTRGPDFLEGNKKFRTARGFIYVVESNGGEISVDSGDSWETLDYSKLTADADGLYTGKIEFRSHSGHVDYSTVQVRTTGTAPLTVTAISLEVVKGERGIR